MIIPKTRKFFVLGADLGKPGEPTAFAVLERAKPADWSPFEECPVGSLEFRVRDLRRFLPNTTYMGIGAAIAKRFNTGELAETTERSPHGTIREIDIITGFVIDQTSVGEEIANLVEQAAGKTARRVVLTSAHTEEYSHGLYRVPRENLIGGVISLLEKRQLKFAGDLSGSKDLVDELVNYSRRKTSSVTGIADTWREQPADDLVFAVALALWFLKKDEGFRYDLVG